jgi:uncharacterized membrane protein YfhO
VKYSLSKRDKPAALNHGYEMVGQVQDVRILRNRYALPLGFTYTRYVKKSVFDTLPTSLRRIAVTKGFVIDDARVGEFSQLRPADIKMTGTDYTAEAYVEDMEALGERHLMITEHGQNRMKGTIDLDEKRLVFFSIPFDKGWQAAVNGRSAELLLVNAGFMGLLLDKGHHEVVLHFTPRYLKTGTAISLLSLLTYLSLLWIRHRHNRRFGQ